MLLYDHAFDCVCPSFIWQSPVTFLACIKIGFYYKHSNAGSQLV